MDDDDELYRYETALCPSLEFHAGTGAGMHVIKLLIHEKGIVIS